MTITMLIVEDSDGLRSSLAESFGRKGHEVLCATRVAEATRLLRERKIDLALFDVRLPDGSGLDLLREALTIDERILVIMMTAFPEVKAAVSALQEGAYDYIVKPFDLQELHIIGERALERRQLSRKVLHLERNQVSQEGFKEILGESPMIEQLRIQISKVAESEAPVFVVGKTGTGKELVANLVHRLSSRREGPLIAVNCSAFSEQLLESELFGHEKGSFTGAGEARIGLFEMADGGTLFLDEITEMKSELQAKLLRIVEGHPFRRVGGKREIHTSVRLIASTNRDLPSLVRSGAFRDDLYFRLNVFQIKVPSLRERGSDVVLLARFFLEQSARALRKGTLGLSPSVEKILLSYEWPGNVRELRNIMERVAILCDGGEIETEHLPGQLQSDAFIRRSVDRGTGAMPSLQDVERDYIAHVLASAGGNLSEAARILGIARNTLKTKLGATGNPPRELG